MTRIFCDRCKKEIEGTQLCVEIFDGPEGESLETADLCTDCKNDLIDWLCPEETVAPA